MIASAIRPTKKNFMARNTTTGTADSRTQSEEDAAVKSCLESNPGGDARLEMLASDALLSRGATIPAEGDSCHCQGLSKN
jgi:hypothetical protein